MLSDSTFSVLLLIFPRAFTVCNKTGNVTWGRSIQPLLQWKSNVLHIVSVCS